MQEVQCNLDSCFLCTSCIPEWKEVIALKKKTIPYKKGKNIFRQGEKVKGIYFIYSGSVKVYTSWGDQKQLILRFAKAGDILGHRGLGKEDIYPISATALEDSSACFIPSDLLEASLKTNPSFTYRLMHFYARELQRAEKRMRNLAHMEVKGRIADALLELDTVFGQDHHKYIATPVTRQDIASYAGTTYETVFKFFTELTAAKIIMTKGKAIMIRDQAKLKLYITKENR